ncbi:hypothetical protein HMPREF9248_0952 [Fannyhessea vaginae PB189-T1-4]|uniref:Uncharacterized protein n=1 Tax=Fannyhessea vaginae PB189-T1-4 TaxID=866774 RepID=A0ABN0B0N8_9ACTN|nr:hypothetical protein HMPREF9248_0952 [Fannyhessea vaginae PB189-T1-4]
MRGVFFVLICAGCYLRTTPRLRAAIRDAARQLLRVVYKIVYKMSRSMV